MLAAKGEWAVFGRISTIITKNGPKRNVEMVFEKDKGAVQNDFTTGWTIAEIAQIHDKLVVWAREQGELV